MVAGFGGGYYARACVMRSLLGLTHEFGGLLEISGVEAVVALCSVI